MKLNNMKIGVRLGLGFGAVLLLLVAISLMAMSSLGKVNDNLEKIVQLPLQLPRAGDAALKNYLNSHMPTAAAVIKQEEEKKKKEAVNPATPTNLDIVNPPSPIRLPAVQPRPG